MTVNNTTSSYNNDCGNQDQFKGAVTLNHVTAEYNYYGTAEGIDIETTGTVTFLSTLGENTVYYGNSLGRIDHGWRGGLDQQAFLHQQRPDQPGYR